MYDQHHDNRDRTSMRRISFFHTQDAVRERRKTVTRRLGWANLQPGTQLLAVSKCQGLKKGEKAEIFGVIRVVSVRREPVKAISYLDVILECVEKPKIFTPQEFVKFFCEMNKCEPDRLITRIEFEYVD